MDENKIVGLNVSRAQREINEFINAANAAGKSLDSSFINLFNFLTDQWASPNAANYTYKVANKAYDCVQKYFINVEHIASGAIRAGQLLASSHGSYFPEIDYSILHREVNPDGGYGVCLTEKNGTTGMDTAGVKVTLDTFKSDMTNALNSLSAVPNGISFYDTEGALLSTYDRGITELRDEFNNLFNSITDDINSYIETETDNILIAKQQAQDSMSA